MWEEDALVGELVAPELALASVRRLFVDSYNSLRVGLAGPDSFTTSICDLAPAFPASGVTYCTAENHQLCTSWQVFGRHALGILEGDPGCSGLCWGFSGLTFCRFRTTSDH